MKKTLIINRAIPASGKSTYAKEIVKVFKQNGLSAVIHSSDDFFMLDGEYRFDADKLREYHLKNQSNFSDSVKHGIDLVICDNTNIEPWEAKPYYDMAKAYDYNVILLDFQPRDIHEHLKAQNNDDYKHNIPLKTLQSMQERYENYDELTAKSSYPTSKQPKKDYDEKTKKVEIKNELSEPFYYDALIKIKADEYLKVKDIIGSLILKKVRDFDLDEIKLIPNHYKIIMQEFEKRADKTLTAYDLKDILDKSPKQIERYFDELIFEFSNITKVKQGKKKAYKLIDSFEVFTEAFKQNDDFEELFYLAEKSNPDLFKKLDLTMKKENDIFTFKNAIFESIKNRDIFDKLKTAIKLNEYRDIKFDYEDEFITIKPIKFVFTDNNWYLAYVNEKNSLKLGRIAFIESVKYTHKNSYQKSSIEVHLKNLEQNLQNAMTLFDVEVKTAKLKATPNISKYFKTGMKKFFKSQKFIQEDNGSVIFSIEYTQPLEILPFVQKWLPDLVILEPKELKEHYKDKLQQTLENLK